MEVKTNLHNFCKFLDRTKTTRNSKRLKDLDLDLSFKQVWIMNGWYILCDKHITLMAHREQTETGVAGFPFRYADSVLSNSARQVQGTHELTVKMGKAEFRAPIEEIEGKEKYKGELITAHKASIDINRATVVENATVYPVIHTNLENLITSDRQRNEDAAERFTWAHTFFTITPQITAEIKKALHLQKYVAGKVYMGWFRQGDEGVTYELCAYSQSYDEAKRLYRTGVQISVPNAPGAFTFNPVMVNEVLDFFATDNVIVELCSYKKDKEPVLFQFTSADEPEYLGLMAHVEPPHFSLESFHKAEPFTFSYKKKSITIHVSENDKADIERRLAAPEYEKPFRNSIWKF